jgi:hypothetical protein
MAYTGDQAFFNQYSDTVYFTLREKASKMMALVPTEFKSVKKGEKHFFNRFGKLTISEVLNRNVVLDAQDADFSRRMATVKRKYGRLFEDTIDTMKQNINYTSSSAREFARAQGETFDISVYDAMLGDASGGKDGELTVPFDTNQVVGSDLVRLTPTLFNEALFKLGENEVDMDSTPIFMCMNPKGEQDLADDDTNKFLSIDFQNDKMLASRKLPMYRGVNIIRTTRVPDVDATTVRSLMFTPDVVNVVMPEALTLKVDERNDLAHVTQVTTYFMYGIVRMQEGNVVDVHYQKVNS